MKLWKKKVKEFGKDFEQSEEFEKNEEIGDAEEFETEEPGKEPKVLEKLKGAGRKIGGFVKKHKLLTILLVLVLIAAIVAGVIWRGKSKKPQMQAMTIETARIEKMDLTNSVSVTGTLATANGKTASTTLKDINVTKVYVEVGDEVQEGDIICTFDSSDIEDALADAKNNYAVNRQLDALDNYETQYQDTVSDAEDSLQDAKDTRDAYKNAYANAQTAEQEALDKLNSVKVQYDTDSLKNAYDQAAGNLKSAIEAVDSTVTITDLESYLSSVNGSLPESCSSAYSAYQNAKAAYGEAQKAVSEAQSAYEQTQAAASQAYSAYSQAQSAREQAQDQYDSTVEQAEKTYEKAKLQDQLVSDDDALNKIEDYEEQLSDCTVYASMSGTITALNVEEDNVFAGGTIYEIQDVHNFVVDATVDEYDVVNLEKGQTAYVKTDSLGDEELEGEVTYVAPAGTTGQTMGSNSGTASYEIQITLNEPQDKLRAGMTASVSIALEESRDALAVPYDCVQTNAGGDSVIYVDDNGEKKEVKVTTGIETDYYTEVISDELSEGMTVYLSTPLQQSTGQSGSDDAGSQDGVTFNFGGGGDMGGGPSGGSGGSGGRASGGGGAPGGF